MVNILFSLWILGGLFNIGFAVSLRKRLHPYNWLLYILSFLLSWAMLGWFFGEVFKMMFHIVFKVKEQLTEDPSETDSPKWARR